MRATGARCRLPPGVGEPGEQYLAPMALVRNGRRLRLDMERELVTEEALMSRHRLQGVDDLAAVKVVHIEGDGRFSVVARDGANGRAPDRAMG